MTFKVLVVDDEPDLELLIKQRFRKRIREGEFEFVFAQNGEEALIKLKEDPALDIVMSDINMPVMDGLTLLSRLTDIDRILKAVIVSAYGDMQNIRTAMNRGAYDFLMKPIDFRISKSLSIRQSRNWKASRQAFARARNSPQFSTSSASPRASSNRYCRGNSPHFHRVPNLRFTPT